METKILRPTCPHRIDGNRERIIVNNFSFSIAKINVFDCQNRYNGNRKRLILGRRLSFWQSKTPYIAIVNDFSENERSFVIAAYPIALSCFVRRKLTKGSLCYTSSARQRLESVCGKVQADLPLRWVHLRPFRLSCHAYEMSLGVRKPVFGVPDQVRHKLGCTTT